MKIKNISDFKEADKKLPLRKISSEEIKIVDIENVWDGPLSGRCRWQEEEYYFFCFDQLNNEGTEDRWPRKYLLTKLTEKQSKENTKLFSLFENLNQGIINKEEYLEISQSLPSLMINKEQIIAWFDSGSSHDNVPSKFLESFQDWKIRQHNNTKS